ncbi:MAG: RHS repeat domain-containing protein [Saprospiraceae bacterium]
MPKYYPFGWAMPGRKFTSEAYRFGFNGMEKDDDIKGEGNSYDFGARIYDSRIGRWLSLDPLMSKYPEFSPYNFVSNKPIIAVDYDGRDFIIVINRKTRTVTVIAKYNYSEIADKASVQRFNKRKSRNYTVSSYISIIKADVEKHYKERVVKVEGEDWNVNFELEFVNHSTAKERNQSKKTWADNRLVLDDSPDLSASNGQYFKNTVYLDPIPENTKNTPSHEILHSLSLRHKDGEIYSKDGEKSPFSTGRTGSEGSLMTYAKNRVLSDKEVITIIEKAIMKTDKNKVKTFGVDADGLHRVHEEIPHGLKGIEELKNNGKLRKAKKAEKHYQKSLKK